MKILFESRVFALEKRGVLVEELTRQGFEVVAEGPADFAISVERGKGAAELWLASDADIGLLRWAQRMARDLGGMARRGYPGNPAGDFAFNCKGVPSVVVRAAEVPDAALVARGLCGLLGVPYKAPPAVEAVPAEKGKRARRDKTEDQSEDVG